ncbi:type VI secretion system amidase effector protein Tae4 [Sphaerospermopsis sp. FACHB-1094]|uniref:type VI secretion system amidase effector protein Tae4 n=1 Tax=Sphaerospermopsis sp. FACHB-1094 TaxID=2692861 RepID=UPI0016841DC7|nr:type VI secretion system amidase effector protein Tae4 [Sphaerospermopsis sp. FACHB-1094]MBD2131374.1 type VI secretion system amidase effector protein Tae4 [Sphaerospermopsis sp. FACHB-1094]
MRKWRLFLITLISFIAILGENWVKKIIPISLCILLNSNSAACYINFNDGQVEAAIANINLTDNSSNQILTFNQDLPTKQEDNFQHKLPSQIAIPPIIRPAETNLYLQNALPKDFRISSQIPYSSGKQEILLVSPSTGAEQLYTFNVPGSRSFQLFEVEYKKVSAIDFSSLTNTDSLIVNPEQIKSVLNKFKITFANNSLSKITLLDGTTANFSPGQAIIKSPQGQTMETVKISQNEFIDQNILLSQERGKMNKNLENNITNKNANLLAKTSESACQAAVSSSLNGISDSLGLWGNKLTTSKSLITKSVGWAISFGSGAIKSNISTKNPMLQEVNCRPPVQCEEQRVSGGSEIRTDLFQVAKGANRKVNLKFEFYVIPDRIELYFDGKQIFGLGPKSGPGNETFDLPTNAEYVGVKLIGNDDVNTRWDYVISCSGSQLAEAPKCENVVNQNSISNSWGDLLQLPYINDSISLLRDKQQSKKIKLPSFDVMEINYPYGSTDQVKSEIGGKINADWIINTCAIRMSRVLNYSVPELQISKQGNLTISGNDKKWYFYRVSDLIKYLTNNLGKADIYLTRSNNGEIDISRLNDKKGIIIFEVPFTNATGHATLWNGKNCVDEQCYFDKATAIYFWKAE